MEKQPSTQRGRGGYLEALLNSCPDAVLAIDADGIITFANKEACKLAECEMRELVGESIVNIYESVEAARETNRKLYKSGGIIHDHESSAKTGSGKIIPIRISASHLKDSAGNYSGAVGYFQRYRPWGEAEVKMKAYAEELEAKLEEWKDLSAPVYELYPGLAVVVVVGRLDASRFERISTNLMDHLTAVKTRTVLINLTAALVAAGSSANAVATQLIKTVRTVNLLGAKCVLAGICSPIAEAMESQLTDVCSIKSFCSTAFALEAAFSSIGLEFCRKDTK